MFSQVAPSDAPNAGISPELSQLIQVKL